MPAKIRSKKREIGEKELCPCGSGIKYKYCHKKTTKKYFEFDNGDVVAEVAIQVIGKTDWRSKRYFPLRIYLQSFV
ncbi:SEC-C domain-containing protein [Rhizobium indicum]|uniref:SEC-C metal-binding domain-containing protein n=1 Tax=Rhizobium indicum TaxID=2583231 RepID=UPI0011064D85|nr:SEC-C domain-containing protein [Rhizobium indicum]